MSTFQQVAWRNREDAAKTGQGRGSTAMAAPESNVIKSTCFQNNLAASWSMNYIKARPKPGSLLRNHHGSVNWGRGSENGEVRIEPRERHRENRKHLVTNRMSRVRAEESCKDDFVFQHEIGTTGREARLERKIMGSVL